MPAEKQHIWGATEVPHEISIELSWEEVRPYICQYFDFVEDRFSIEDLDFLTEGFVSLVCHSCRWLDH